MPGDAGEFSVNIGLGINFLAGGTLFLNSNDTLSYLSTATTLMTGMGWRHIVLTAAAEDVHCCLTEGGFSKGRS